MATLFAYTVKPGSPDLASGPSYAAIILIDTPRTVLRTHPLL